MALSVGLQAAPVPVPKDDRSPAEIEAARTDLARLRRYAADGKRNPAELWKLWAQFRMRHPASPEYMEAAEVMRKVPSPLDKLDRSQIPVEDRTPWLPKEVVAVLGDQRGRSWGGFGRLSFSRDDKLLLSGGQAWDAVTLRERVNPFRWLVTAPDGKTAAIRGTVMSPEARRHLYQDTFIRLLDIRGDKHIVLAEIQRECHDLDHLAWSQDGRLLLASGRILPLNRKGDELTRRGVVQQTIVCEVKDHKLHLLHEIDVEPGGGSQAAFALGGKYLLDNGGKRKALRLWDVRGDKAKLCVTIPNVCQGGFTLSADGRMVAFPQPSRLRGINAKMVAVWTLTEAGPQRPRFFEGMWPGLGEMQFSPDGTLLACLGFQASGLWLCPLTEARRRELGMGKDKDSTKYYRLTFTPETLRFYPDSNKMVIGGTDCIIHFWDWKKGEKAFRHTGHRGYVSDISFAPDGNCLASVGGDGTIRLWEWQGKAVRERACVATERPGRRIAFAPDGEKLAVCADAHADRKDTEKDVISLWNLNKGRLVRQDSLEPLSEEERLVGMAFAAGGKTLFTVIDDHDPLHLGWGVATACFWNLDSPSPFPLSRINFGDYVEKKEEVDSTDVYITNVMLSPSGKQLAFLNGRGEKSVKLLQRRGGSWGKTLEMKSPDQEGEISCIAYSADGRRFITGGWRRRTRDVFAPLSLVIRFWETRQRLAEIRPPLIADGFGYIDRLVVSPDGRRIAVRGGVRIAVWDLPLRRKVLDWFPPLSLHGVTFGFSADGRHLATANPNGTVYLFRLPEESAKHNAD